jgi:hypothetical protein
MSAFFCDYYNAVQAEPVEASVLAVKAANQ